jgi:hypothetical protein
MTKLMENNVNMEYAAFIISGSFSYELKGSIEHSGEMKTASCSSLTDSQKSSARILRIQQLRSHRIFIERK